MKFAISLTHNCNLNCRYCYAGSKFKENMTFETATKVIHFIDNITKNVNTNQIITIGFFGGEPLLCYDLIKRIIDYSNKNIKNNGSIKFSITTNGLLLNKDRLEYLKSQNVDLCISIDGNEEIHNLNRIYLNGRGSFNQVLKNVLLTKKIYGILQVNAVYGPKTLKYLPLTVSFFRTIGASIIHLNPNIRAEWNKESESELFFSYLEIAREFINSYENNEEIAINIIDSKIILLLKGGYTMEDRCGMAKTEWAFAPSGNIYPCERLIGDDNNKSLCLGNVITGLNYTSQNSIIKNCGNKEVKCLTCNIRSFCMNWCGCTNYFSTGLLDSTGDFQCKSEQSLVKIAKFVLVKLKDNDLFLDHFMSYINESYITN